MEPIQAIVLGIIQGLTEFLPVSSSGHLVIFQHLFQITEPVVSFDISVHFGTLLVVIIFFRKDLMAMLTALVKKVPALCKQNKSLNSINESKELKLVFLIVAGSIPTGIIGIFFHKIADRLFSSILLVGFMLFSVSSHHHRFGPGNRYYSGHIKIRVNDCCRFAAWARQTDSSEVFFSFVDTCNLWRRNT